MGSQAHHPNVGAEATPVRVTREIDYSCLHNYVIISNFKDCLPHLISSHVNRIRKIALTCFSNRNIH